MLESTRTFIQKLYKQSEKFLCASYDAQGMELDVHHFVMARNPCMHFTVKAEQFPKYYILAGGGRCCYASTKNSVQKQNVENSKQSVAPISVFMHH